MIIQNINKILDLKTSIFLCQNFDFKRFFMQKWLNQ